MTKLRNICYLRFGSKIRQGFTVATPSLTPRLFFFPLWMLFAANAGVGGLSFYIGRSLSPPAGRSACLPPLHRAAGACRPAGGWQAPARGLRTQKIIFIYM